MRDIAWAAGLFEGEGSITFHVARRSDTLQGGVLRNYEHGSVQLTLAMTDQDVVEAFELVVGVGSTRRTHPPSKQAAGNKPQWRWQSSGPHAEELAWRLMPYLGNRRREQFFEAKRKLQQHREANEAKRTGASE